MEEVCVPTNHRNIVFHVMVVDPKTSNFLASSENGSDSRLHLPILNKIYGYTVYGDAEELTAIADKMFHHVGRPVYLRSEVEIYTSLGHTPLCSVFMFELDDGAEKQQIPGLKWVPKGQADRVCTSPELKQDVGRFLKLYKEQGLDTNSSLFWTFSKPWWYRDIYQWLKK